MGMGAWTKDEVQDVVVLSQPKYPANDIWCVARNDWGNINVYVSNYKSDVMSHFTGAGNRILCRLSTSGEITEVDSNWVMWSRNPATELGARTVLMSIRDD